jgi:hypothetical protein
MKKELFILGSIIIMSFNALSQECNCSESFEWMISTFEKNDAGFQYVIDKKGLDDYNKFTANFKEKANNVTSVNDCHRIMLDWLHYFRKGHIGVGIKGTGVKDKKPIDDETRQKYKNEKTIDLTDKQLIDILNKKQNKNPIEGIWSDEKYTIGIINNGDSNNKYTAFIIKADSAHWLPKQVKAEFTVNNDTKTYSVNYYAQDHSKQICQAKFINESNTILFLYNDYWIQQFPDTILTKNERLFLSFLKEKHPFVEKLSDKTIYLRIPSFEYNQKEYIDSVLSKNDKLIKSTPNLIIDIRNGTGGSSHSWENIIPYLYTNTIRDMENQYLATELNAKEYESYAKNFKDTSISKRCSNIAKKMREHFGEFITLSNQKYSIYTLDKVFPYPIKVAVICNKYNGSADEGFLYDAKQSTKVKVFGVPTMGCFDISNVNYVNSPDGKFTLHYCMTKSLSIPDYCIDDIGIQPDYFIDDSIKEEDWIEYTKTVLEQQYIKNR